MHLLVQIESIINVQLNHYQLLFLMRFLETLGEMTCFLTQDVRHILGEDDESSMVLGLCAPQVDACLLMPTASPAATTSASGVAPGTDADQHSNASTPPLTLSLPDCAPDTPKQTRSRSPR